MRYIISRKDSPFIVSNYLKILSGSISQRCDLLRQHLLRYLSFIIGLLLFAANASAQVDSLFATPYQLHPEREGELRMDIDNLNFFQDNEFKGEVVKGYTLPGVWWQPRLSYYPLPNLKLEAGAHLLYYSGSHQYPVGIYEGVADWRQQKDKENGVHAQPFFRVQLSMRNNHLNLILGNLYGGSTHRLIEPLYNPELNLSADPETGMQMLYNSRFLDADLWINWQSFIFKNDKHQEKFTLGLSTRLKLNSPDAPLHVYIPFQVLSRHIGGEIQDSAYHHNTASVANLAIGAGADWNLKNAFLTQVQAETEFIAYKQLKGDAGIFTKGHAFHASVTLRTKRVSLKTGYMNSCHFISLLGSPFFGSLGTTSAKALYPHPQTVYSSLEYSHRFGKICSLGADITLYQYIPGKARISGTWSHPSSSANISAGVFLRVTPSLLIHKFK